MLLKITNNVSKKSLTFIVNDTYTSNIYFNFEIRLEENLEGIKLSEIDEGEYNYELFDEGKKIAEGLLQIGDYKAENKEYNKDKNGFKVYGKK
jgi:hypothetical protein